MKTVIIPSNPNHPFADNHTVVSEIFPGESINYILVDIRPVPDSYNDLMTICRERESRKSFSAEYCEAVTTFAGSVEKCNASLDHIYGDSVPVFRNYLEYRRADLVIFDQAQWLDHPQFQMSDIFKMVMRSGADLLYVPVAEKGVAKRFTSMDNHRASSQVRFTPKPQFAAATAGMSGTYETTVATALAPASVVAGYTSVDQMLNNLQNEVLIENILIRQVSRLGRYFIKPSAVQRMLADSKRELLWFKK